MRPSEAAESLAGLLRQATREPQHYRDGIGDRRRQEELDRRCRQCLPAIVALLESLPDQPQWMEAE